MNFDIPEEKVEEIVRFWVEPGFGYMAVEELNELQKAILKIERTWFRPELVGDHESLLLEEKRERKALVDEIGDVLISLEGIIDMYQIPREAIQARIDSKLEKVYD